MLVKELGEFGLIDYIDRLIKRADGGPKKVALGIGDDAAVVDPPSGAKMLLTTDTMVENVHFNTRYIKPADIGYKAMAVNISDIAAMAGSPEYALVTLGLTPDAEVEFVAGVYHGLIDAAKAFGVAIVGGDMTKANRFFVTVALTGRAEAGLTRRRSDAKAGDAIMVTGSLGGSAAALKLLKEGAKPTRGWLAHLAARHTQPTPRVAEARAAAAAGARAMQDISDGLLADLTHICSASGLGASLDSMAVPVFPEAAKAGFKTQDAQRLAITGGEDYELLFTAPAAKVEAIKAAIAAVSDTPVTVVGEMAAGPAEVVVTGHAGKPMVMKRRGYDHFQNG